MSDKEKYVEVTVRLPKRIVDFLKAQEKHLEMTVQEYLEYSIIQCVGADFDLLDWGPFTFDYDKPEEVITQHGLNEVLKATVASGFC